MLNYLVTDAKTVTTNTPDEFIALCGVVAFGACAAVRAEWRGEVFALLGDFACSAAWRVGEGVAIAFQQLLPVAAEESIEYLVEVATKGNCLQQRASIAGIAEPSLLYMPAIVEAGLTIQRLELDRLHAIPLGEPKLDDLRE